MILAEELHADIIERSVKTSPSKNMPWLREELGDVQAPLLRLAP